MESLAAVLRRIPLFADLPTGSFARIIADLREERHPPGTVICYEGDEARDFYIIKSGRVDVLVNRGWNQRELVAESGPSEWFGERALFTDRPRSATVVARTDVELWRLTKEKFDDLIEEHPWLIVHFTQVMSDRLMRGNHELSKLQAAFTQQMDAWFRAQPPARQRFLTHSAVLAGLEPTVVSDLLGRTEAAAVLAELDAAGGLVSRYDGVLHYLEAVRDFLLVQLTAEIGGDGVRTLHKQAATLYGRQQRWEQAINHYLDAEEYHAAARLLATHLEPLVEAKRFDLLRGWSQRLQAGGDDPILADTRARIEAVLRRPDDVAAREVSTTWFARALALWTRPWMSAAFGVGLGLMIWAAPLLDGLSPAAMHMLALLAWAAVFWAFDVLPDYVVGLGMIIGWILLGIVPIEVAVSGFTAGPFFLIIGVLGIAAALESSGFLFRLALQILRRFPLTHRGQSLGLALSGTAIAPCIPDVTSDMAMAAPIILALSDSLGYARGSKGSAGLAMAALLGFGQMSPFFLTGAAENLLAWGLLPPALRAEVSWGGWFLAALPLALVTFALGYLFTQILLPPEIQPTVSRGLIDTQIEALGRPSRAEIVNAVVLIGAVIGWITAPYHGVDVAWVAMSALALLLAANLLDRATFRAGIYWDFIFYLGAVLSLTGVVRTLGVDDWVIRRLAPFVQPLAASPAAFLLVVTVAIFAARFILPSFPLVSVLTITLVPIAAHAGISALALLLVICTSTSVWFLPYQSTYYLALYFGTKEKAFSHRQVRLLAWSYGLIYFLAILIAIPFWRLLGLVP
jgi:anion transporter